MSQDGADSTLGDDDGSDTSTSLRSTATRFEWNHGRRYHSYRPGSYPFPNDEREQDRLDMLHTAVLRILDGRLFLSPIRPEGMRILDIGTGTGAWPIQMGDTYPGACIAGNDLSPIQPVWVPANVEFIVDDVELEWAQPSRYDFIHCRYMASSITNWPRLMRRIHESLKPGGWVEFQESSAQYYTADGELDGGNPLVQLTTALRQACRRTGRTSDPGPHLRRWAREAGFPHAEEHVFRVPVGAWPKDQRGKEIGAMMSVNLVEGVDALTGVLMRDVLAGPRRSWNC